MPTLYLAGPIFTQPEQQWLAELKRDRASRLNMLYEVFAAPVPHLSSRVLPDQQQQAAGS